MRSWSNAVMAVSKIRYVVLSEAVGDPVQATIATSAGAA